MPRHTLTDKDFVGRTALCSICGPVAIRKVGSGWICSVKKREASASWRARNPERQVLTKYSRSEHSLISFNPDIREGVCPLDGHVTIARHGRGWMCKVRMEELGWSEDESPVQKCTHCGFWSTRENPVSGGVCGTCLDPMAPLKPSFRLSKRNRVDIIAAGLDTQESRTEDPTEVMARFEDIAYLVEQADADPYRSDGWDSVKPGPRVIGPPIDKSSPWYQDYLQQLKLTRKSRERRSR